MTDQRRFTRIAYDSEAVFITDKESYDGTLVDVSLKGALMQLDDPSITPDLDEAGQLKIVIEGSDISIQMQAHCVHVQDGQVGLECDTLDIDSAAHLRRLVEVNLGSDDLLHREVEALIHSRTNN